ncbi:hypothetical protein PM082_004872 [Marasmius tenuissimus]|nr:hypothetical protein PM082_004872 [Marasmius tenuissimus]
MGYPDESVSDPRIELDTRRLRDRSSRGFVGFARSPTDRDESQSGGGAGCDERGLAEMFERRKLGSTVRQGRGRPDFTLLLTHKIYFGHTFLICFTRHDNTACCKITISNLLLMFAFSISSGLRLRATFGWRLARLYPNAFFSVPRFKLGPAHHTFEFIENAHRQEADSSARARAIYRLLVGGGPRATD